MEPDDFNEKYSELVDFVSMEMFNIERTDLGDDEEVNVFDVIGLESVNDRCIANEDEGTYGINDVEAAVPDSDGKM